MQINIEELNKSFERLGNCNDLLKREKELLQEVERLKLEEKKYRELYSLYLANSAQLKQSFKELDKHNDLLDLESKLLEEAKRLGLEEKKYRELYSLYLANSAQLKQSFKELDKHNDLLELESKLLEEAKRLGLEEKKYRELYSLYLANSAQLKQSFKELDKHNDLLELESKLLEEAKRLGLEEKKYRELYSLYLANSAQLKQSFKELDKHNDLLELESKLLEEAKRLGLEEKKYRELYSLYLISSEQQLEKSFKSITSGILSNRLQHERDLAREAQRFGITVDEYRQLYRFSYNQLLRLFVRGSSLREKKAWDYIQLVCIPICLGLITWWFNGLTKDREIDIQGDRQKQEILNKYFDAMTAQSKGNETEQKKQRGNRQNSNEQEIKKARTLSVLRELNHERNAQVLRFLKKAQWLPEQSEGKQEIDLSEGDLGKAKLDKADLRYVRWQFTIFHSAELRKARLDQAELQNSDFTNAHLDGANMVGAILTDAKFINAKLVCAEPDEPEDQPWWSKDKDQRRCANLAAADLKGANLNGANLEGVDLSGANLEGADLSGANLKGADLSGANLKGAKQNQEKLKISQLQGTTLCKTKIDIDSKIETKIDQELKEENNGCNLGDYIVVNFGVPLPVFDSPEPEKGKRITSLGNGAIIKKIINEKVYYKCESNQCYYIKLVQISSEQPALSPIKNLATETKNFWIQKEKGNYEQVNGQIKLKPTITFLRRLS